MSVAAVLLVSMGGAILAAPITLPLLYLAARTSLDAAYRWIAGTIGGLTAAEAGWAIAYVAVGETKPFIWLAPLIVGVATVGLLTRPGSRQPDRMSPSPSPGG